MSTLEIHRLSVEYPGRHGSVSALRCFEVRVPEGGMLVLLGQSGCGKSTALSAIAGLTTPSAGRISLGGDVLFEAGAVTVPPERRDISMVFQSYALWPHLSVLENVAYPLRRRGMAAKAAQIAAREALQVVQCAQFAPRIPGELSGGQQQRIALARALVGRPRLLLFDEPLSNLDASLRRDLRDELSRLHRQIGFTGVYVTHDQSEALCLATDIAVMDGGRIVQRGTPQDIYEKPATEFVARFFGANVLPGRVGQSDSSGCQVDTPAGSLLCCGTVPSGAVVAAFMPHAVSVLPDQRGPMTISAAIYQGSHQEVRLTVVRRRKHRCRPRPGSCQDCRSPPATRSSQSSVRVYPAAHSGRSSRDIAHPPPYRHAAP